VVTVKTTTGQDVPYNILGNVWAVQKPKYSWMAATSWYKITGYRAPDGSFHAKQSSAQIQAACNDTINSNYLLARTFSPQVPTGATLLYYAESSSKYDFDRPIWPSDLSSRPKTQFTNLVTFGDSLSDIGNDKTWTLGFVPSSVYLGGRFSNGLNWTDYLSQKLNMATFNWAYGGSETGNDVALGIVVPLTKQVDEYLTKKGYRCLKVPLIGDICNLYGGYHNQNNTLYAVWSGANNYFNMISYKQGEPTPADTNKSYSISFAAEAKNNNGYLIYKNAKQEVNDDTFVNITIQDIRGSIERLINEGGAKFILVPNEPPLAHIPGEQPQALQDTIGFGSADALGANNRLRDIMIVHNKRLDKMIDALQTQYASKNVVFIRMDIHKLLLETLRDPKKYLSKDGSSNVVIPTPFTTSSYFRNLNDNVITANNTYTPSPSPETSEAISAPKPCYENIMKLSEIAESAGGIFLKTTFDLLGLTIAPLIGVDTNLKTSNFYTNTAKQGRLCATPQNYIFFDIVHPTTQVHSVLGNMMADYIQNQASYTTKDASRVQQ
jgi:phospholipase/lecithinase/hemolysin